MGAWNEKLLEVISTVVPLPASPVLEGGVSSPGLPWNWRFRVTLKVSCYIEPSGTLVRRWQQRNPI